MRRPDALDYVRSARCGFVFPRALMKSTSAALACLKFGSGPPTTKEFMPQPDTVPVHHVALAVIGDLSNASFAIVSLHVRTADPIRLSG